MKKSLKQRFNEMHPEKRRKALVGGVIGALVIVASGVVLVTDDSSQRTSKKKADPKADGLENLLMATPSREMGLAGEAKTNVEQSQQIAQLMAEVDRLKKGGGADPGGDPDQELEKLADQMAKNSPEEIGSAPPGTVFSRERPSTTPDFRIPESARPGPVPQLPNVPGGPTGAANEMMVPPPPPPPPVAPTINTVKSETPKVSAAVKRLKHVYLPTGALMSGVLLNGLDAPTGRSAQNAPIPVVVRVKHEAILPSQYRSDVREAFILAAGFGDLSSERAYLRAERFSMILRNGEVIDIPIKMSAVGHDGKSGLRGRVVSKQGAVIAKAMLAGTADGISRAFGGSRGYSRGGDGLPSDSELATSAIQGGVGGGLDRITDYFLSQADAMHPVVEIDAGRDVTFVLLEGTELTPRSAEEEEKSRTAPGAKNANTVAAK